MLDLGSHPVGVQCPEQPTVRRRRRAVPLLVDVSSRGAREGVSVKAAMAVALVYAFTVRSDVTVTGEITLR